MLDPRTLFVTLIALLIITGVIQLVSAREAREDSGLLHWGAANLLAAIGIALAGLVVHKPVPLVISLAFSCLTLAYGLNWAGMRRFCRQPAPPVAIITPALVWLLLSQTPLLQAVHWRIAATAAVTAAWCLTTAWTLWRFDGEPLAARRATIAWLTFYGMVMLIRVPVALSQTFPDAATAFVSATMTLAIFGAVIHVVVLSFLQLALTKGRADNRFREAAETDMLTGVANRRAFFGRAAPLADRAAREGRPAAVLVIDIDRFKAINDSLGHAGGDAVIIAVARAIRDGLRPGDVFGRLGGEEFGCLLPDTSLTEATAIAEALRSRIASQNLAFDGTTVQVSVSVGIAVTGAGIATIDRLLAEADAGLYQAKRSGRDRVVAMDLAFVG
jgi:diguanylate cyclase (GGDEF)-like protein